MPENASHRTIRSFVRRTGRLTPSQQRALDELWPRYGIGFDDKLIDFNTAFARTAPVILEIGFGNGETLVKQASEHPEQDYIGVEVHEPGVGHCLLKAREAKIENLRLIMHDGIEVLTQQVPMQSLQRVNLYFPDPWPKKRHHKRRIVTPSFLQLVSNKLTAEGTLQIATDWANYAEHIDDVIAASEVFECAEKREHSGDQPLDRPRTKFEQRGLRKGHRIFDWRLTKLED